MPFAIVPSRPTACPAPGSGFAIALPSVGAAQRAGLGRGLAAALMLTVSCLLVVYAPLAWCGPAGLDARAVEPPPRAAAALRLPATAARMLR